MAQGLVVVTRGGKHLPVGAATELLLSGQSLQRLPRVKVHGPMCWQSHWGGGRLFCATKSLNRCARRLHQIEFLRFEAQSTSRATLSAREKAVGKLLCTSLPHHLVGAQA